MRVFDFDVIQIEQAIDIPSGKIRLEGDLKLLQGATGVVLFAHGSGSSRHSPRNQYVARVIREAGVGTLLFDLLTKQEEAIDAYTGEFRFDIEFLAKRLVDATNWITAQPATQHLRIGYFGASTGAAAALIAAVELPNIVAAIVSRGGRPDLAGRALSKVKAPTLLIVGGDDDVAEIKHSHAGLLRLSKVRGQLSLCYSSGFFGCGIRTTSTEHFLGEVVMIFTAIALGWPLPLLPLQILWMNLVTDVFPALALAVEPPSPAVMKQRPRDPSASLLSKNLLILIGWQALMIAFLALAAYVWALRMYSPGAHARTVALFAIIGAQLGHMFNCRSRTRSALDGIFRNPFIWAATIIVVLLQFLAIYFSPLAIVLGTTRLAEIDWMVIGFCIVTPVIVVEIAEAATKRSVSHMEAKSL